MKRLLRALLPLIIIGAGVQVAMLFYGARPQAAPIERDQAVTFVQTHAVSIGDHTPTVRALGVVAAEKQVSLAPEVAGRVIEQNTALVEGGRIASGDPLIRVDPRDYAAAVAASKAELAQARVQVREEKTLGEVATFEWRDRPEGFSQETLDFALRQPHLEAAQARVQSARSRIARARRDLARTVLKAPFDAVVLTESVDVGQPVSPAVPVVTLAGIGRYQIQVSLPMSQLRFIDVPEVNTADDKGSTATVFNEAAGTADTREGYVVRLHGTIDERGRMAQLFVAVDDPLGVTRPIETRPLPLLLGTRVRVEIAGRPLRNVAVIPRRALLDSEAVWVLSDDNRLQRREVEISWREPGSVVVSSGLQVGDRVVLTSIPNATEGMAVSLSPDPPEGSG